MLVISPFIYFNIIMAKTTINYIKNGLSIQVTLAHLRK